MIGTMRSARLMMGSIFPFAFLPEDNIPSAILCSSDSDDEEGLPNIAQGGHHLALGSTGTVLSVPAATKCSSDGSEEEKRTMEKIQRSLIVMR